MGALKAAVLTFGPTDHDSRVRRIVRLLADMGFATTLLSPDMQKPALPAAHIPLPPAAANRLDLLRRLALQAPSSLVPAAATALHRRLASVRAATQALTSLRPHIIHANDWETLPAAMDAAKATGARVVYDSHEFASGEHDKLLWWRMLARPHVRAVEARHISAADRVITVGDGIAGALRQRYGDRARGLDVIRNLPEAIGCPRSSRADGTVLLAYAGLIRPERRIDLMIRALAMLPENRRLRITGFGPARHIDELRRIARSSGASSRIEWRDAVAPESLVTHLGEADVGLFLSDGVGEQQRFALPNKIFEYTSAGMAVIASGSTDVRELLSRHGHGVFLDQANPEALASAILSLDGGKLGTLQTKALAASRSLNWSVESRKLEVIYQELAAGF